MAAIRGFTQGLGDWWKDMVVELESKLDVIGDRGGHALTWKLDDGTPLAPGELALFMNNSDGTAIDADIAQRLLDHHRAGHPVLPVLDNLVNAPGKLPPGLDGLNALAIEAGDGTRTYDRLVDEIFSLLWWRRRRRRVFLSYKRSDSSGVAHQLRQELTQLGYYVFIDECDIHAGEDVQPEIMSWLTDSDFAILLCSPHLEDSEWVMKEVATARAVLLPLLCVLWPGQRLLKCIKDQITLQHKLKPGDLIGADPPQQTLTAGAFKGLLTQVESYRSRAISQRLRDLRKFLFEELHPEIDITEGTTLGDFDITDRHGTPGLVRVLPFRPTITEMHDLHTDAHQRAGAPEKGYLFYAENDSNDRTRAAVSWALKAPRSQTPKELSLLSLLDGKNDLGDLE